MKFDFGDTVVFGETGGDGSIPTNAVGSIVSITEVATKSESEVFGYPIGTLLYGVEFADGSDRLVPEELLMPK
jgi:hypothetical protein